MRATGTPRHNRTAAGTAGRAPCRSCRAHRWWCAGIFHLFWLALSAVPAAAHPGDVVPPDRLWSTWSLEPWVLLTIGLSAWLYARGTGRLWRRAGVGRGVRRGQLYCFAAGLVVLLLALVSPLDALGGTLFSAHMTQHELLMLLAAPLLVLGAPLLPLLWALPLGWRRRLGGWARISAVRTGWRALTHPLSAWTLHAVAVWVWHAPVLYQATLRSEGVHALQHFSFVGTALLFWWSLWNACRHARAAYGIGVLYIFTTGVHMSALGALLTFSSHPWYPLYEPSARLWGLSALEDQQLGGAIMWVPGGVVYLLAALRLFATWIGSAPAPRPPLPSPAPLAAARDPQWRA